MTAGSIRARVRAEMTEQIKATARAHLATDGANLSLRAVARDLGMASSAVYRYFRSRDELLTELIIDAYNALGDAVEEAESAVLRSDYRGRLRATAHAIRDWARRHPHEYALLYGSPVPGYQAPADTTGPGSRPVLLLTAILRDGVQAGAIVLPDESLPAPVRRDLRQALDALGETRLSEAALARGMAVWTQIFGLISFELFGRLHGAVVAYDDFYDHQLSLILTVLNLHDSTLGE